MSEEKKNNHPVLKAVGIAAGCAAAAYGTATAYVFRQAFDLKHSNLFSGKGGTAYLTFTDNEKSEWYQHSDVKDEYMSSFDGLNLHALCMTNHPDDHKWIVLMVGPGAYNHTIMEYLYELDHAGYNILAVDSRGTGKSEGRYTTLGWAEHYDLISWVNYLINMDESARIALLGVSVGAAAVMNAVGDYIPKNVVCAVEEGGFSEIKELLRNGITLAMKADGRILLPGLDLMCRQVLHFSFNDVSTARQLQQAAVPVLFVQGVDSEFVPESMLFDNYYACGSDRELLTKEDAQEDYFGKVEEFLDRYFK
jgi:pimeloyl-ACP methyl ester carboxylesterase